MESTQHPTPPGSPGLQDELVWRARAYEYLRSSFKAGCIPPSVLHSMGVYRGAAGFWYDKERTSAITSPGVCVSLLHTGRDYADAVQAQGMYYSYPKTERPGASDANEVESARQALELRVPVFVVRPGTATNLRGVDLGWIVGDITSESLLVVEFADYDPRRLGYRDAT